MVAEKHWNRCDVCGEFVSYIEAYRHMITPDSDRSREEWETLCSKCLKKETTDG